MSGGNFVFLGNGGAPIVIIVELEYHVAIAVKYNCCKVKNLESKKDYAISEEWSLFCERTRFFSVRQQEGRKISLFSEIRVSRKGQMFLKYRNRQWTSAIWPSIFMFIRKFPSITGFVFLFRPTKKNIIALAGVILSRFQCITGVVW